MRIVIFNHSFFHLSETFIYRQITGLTKNIEAPLLSFSFANEEHFPTINKKIRLKKSVNIVDKVLSFVLPDRIKSRSGFSIFNYFKVKRILNQLKPDAIHAHFGFNAAMVYPLAKALDIPLIISFHGLDASPKMLKNEAYRNKIREMLHYASAVIVVSPHMISTLGLSAWQNKTHMIPYGVNPAEFTNKTPALNAGYITILHSGRLVAKKGVPDLIRVCINLIKKDYNLRLVIIGDGAELTVCKEIVEMAGCRNIQFLGAQTQDVVKTWMSQTDIFVLNSRTSETGDMEGLPNAILEAMSMRLPVVSTFHAGIPQAITNGVNGILVKERDNEGLEAALKILISNKTMRTEIGIAARQTIKDGFTIELMNRRIADIYKSVIMPSHQITTTASFSFSA